MFFSSLNYFNKGHQNFHYKIFLHNFCIKVYFVRNQNYK